MNRMTYDDESNALRKSASEIMKDVPFFEGQGIDSRHCKISTRTMESRIFDIYMSGTIVESWHYTKLLQILRETGPSDVVNMYINSPGGDIRTAFQIIFALNQCKAIKRISLDGMTDSAASLLVLGCVWDEIAVSPLATMCCHSYSRGSYGKAHEIKQDLEFSYSFLKTKLSLFYKGYLSDTEINQMFEGKDFYFEAKDIQKRIAFKYDSLKSLVKEKMPKEHTEKSPMKPNEKQIKPKYKAKK